MCVLSDTFHSFTQPQHSKPMFSTISSSWRILLSFMLLVGSDSLFSQQDRAFLDRYLSSYASEQGIDPGDLDDMVVTDQFTSQHNGVTHVHIRQRHAGIEVYNGTANLTFQNNQLVHVADRLEQNLAGRANTTQPGISANQAIGFAAQALGLPISGDPQAILQQPESRTTVFYAPSLSQEDIPVTLMYLPGPEGELILVWDLSIYQLDSEHWWSVRVDATNGKLLDKVDWVSHCSFGEPAEAHNHHHSPTPFFPQSIMGIESTSSSYRVIPYFIESPNHGPDSLIVDPVDTVASPFGWHDTDGQSGAEFTITRGNNVYASEDRDADNQPGYSPDGGAFLVFDFPVNLNQPAPAYEDAAITNLFYMNNVVHDLFYQYGFDEVAGNFQENNYGRGGQGGDFVYADAQDGSGSNNANFATPPDGNSGRMQMFLWTSGGSSGPQNLLTVNSPSVIGGPYSATEATFGPGVGTTPITADLVLLNDGTNPDPQDACDPIINAADLSGKIALIDRGNCTFVLKVEAAQNAGALAVIIVNNTGGNPIPMGGFSNTITIPSIMISQANGTLIKNQIAAGDTINVTIQNSNPNFDKDGDFDNGIVAHEYGHGISIRMTGGPSTSGCLSNAEQMGEGWSDYFALITSKDTSFLDRGIGTFAAGETITGIGIRPAKYSPDFAVNPYTYDATNDVFQISQPHGIGFVWCTMLWDLTVALVKKYGYDSDLYHGSGGNNLALQLVMDGIKLQPCNPGFVDGRDAILLADQLNSGGANQCLIWEVFANRGLGFSADQGSSTSRTDQVEAFDLPPICLTPTAAPVANYSFSFSPGCTDKVFFNDQSTSTPQSWFWDFGDGNTDTVQNPVHTYAASGSYLVTMVVTNMLGSDTMFQAAVVTLPSGPVVADTSGCIGEPGSLTVNGTSIYSWYDQAGNLIQTGNTFSSGTLLGDTTVEVDQVILPAPQNVGPLDGSFANGGYHNTGFTGTLNFTAEDEFTLISAWVDAGSPGPRTINLWDNVNGSGNITGSVTVNLVSTGPQRINLNLKVPGAGTYSVGGTSVDLFRNSAGANYPYVIAGLVSINNSSATTGPDEFYYYLYDWEVQGRGCRSERVPVTLSASSADFTFSKATGGSLVTFTDASVNADDWFWDFGDGNTSTMQNPSHGYISEGTYGVTLTVNGKCLKTDSVTIQYNTGLEQLLPGLSLRMQPNPAADRMQLVTNHPLPEDISLDLYSPEGKHICTREMLAGQSSLDWNLEGLSSGLYLVQVRHSKGLVPIKLVIRN